MSGPQLSSPVPDFKLGEKLFSNCLLVHKLLATGCGEELLERWDQISPSILLHKCQYVEHPSMQEKKATPLHLAVEFSSVAVIEAIAKAGAGLVDNEDERRILLHSAVMHNEVDIVRLLVVLVVAGADIGARDDEEKTPLHKVAKHNPSAEAVRVMVEAGADLDAEDCFQWTPMHRAALENPGAVRVLVESGAKVNKLNKDKTWEVSVTPLFYAAKYSHRDAIIALCAAGADPRLGDLSPLDADCVKENMKTLIREQFAIQSSSLMC